MLILQELQLSHPTFCIRAQFENLGELVAQFENLGELVKNTIFVA